MKGEKRLSDYSTLRLSGPMTLSYYTLRALAAEWAEELPGAALADAYSQHRDELALALEAPGAAWTLTVLARPDLRLLFRNEGHGRARRNTATLFEPALGRRIEAVRLAERDRVLFIGLEGGMRLQVQLFGPRPNVWLVAEERVMEALSAGVEGEGERPPTPRPAPEVPSFEAFEARWPARRRTLAQAVAAAMPLFGPTLAAEAVHRAGVRSERPAEATEPERRALFEAARELEAEMEAPRPCIYWRGARAEAFALVPMRHLEAEGDLREEAFGTVDEAVRVFAHRSLAQQRFDAAYRPVERRLAAARERLARSAERMLEELARESRAEAYERFGHLLMAQATGRPPGEDAITLPDLLGEGEPVTIPLDPSLSGVENAERYYARARRTRAARAHAEARWEAVQREAEAAADLLARLRAAERMPELEALLEAERDALGRLLGGAGGEETAEPFRRFPLPGGLEAWVGKSARGNAELTTRHAGPHDLWLHARGVAGAHVVVRRPSREAVLERRAVEAAAGIAAYFSAARTSALVPVQVTERKYVRPLKGGPPGAVRVEREEVLLVEPRLP